MCNKTQCSQHIGRWVEFRTPWGYHQGIIERVTGDTAVVLSPRKYIPVHLASDTSADDVKKLDLALALGGYGYGGLPGYGAGRFGYGGYPGWGWGRWAVSFLVIYALLGLVW